MASEAARTCSLVGARLSSTTYLYPKESATRCVECTIDVSSRPVNRHELFTLS